MTTKRISVAEAARLCGVGRSTVGYWIREKDLRVIRKGRNYLVRVEDLLSFLQANGKKIPTRFELLELKSPLAESIQSCWRYYHGTDHAISCKDCVVQIEQIDTCFSVRSDSRCRCESLCGECGYYRNVILPRIEFIHQIDAPAAVYKDFYLWGGNKHLAKMCGFAKTELPGMGIEEFIHEESLRDAIANTRSRQRGDPQVCSTYHIWFRNREIGKFGVQLTVLPLKNPSGTHLVVAKPTETSLDMD